MNQQISAMSGDHALGLLRARGIIPSEMLVTEVASVLRSLGVSARNHCWPPFGRYSPSPRQRGGTGSSHAATPSPRRRQDAGAAGTPLERQRCAVLALPKRSPAGLLDDLLASRIAATDVSLHQHLALRRWCRQRTMASTAVIQRLVDMGHLKHARRERSKHLQRPEVLLHGLLCAARKQWRVRRDMSSVEMTACQRERLKRAIEQMPKVGKFTAPARARLFCRQKKDGSPRPLNNFYWVDKARQIVLKSALAPFASLHESQFMLARDPGRRGPAAVREALLSALDECGENNLFMQFDIRDFYGSISHDWLEAHLGLDPAMIGKHVHTGNMLIVPTGRTTTVRGHHEARRREKGRWGIPQGSALSSLIAEQAMAGVLRSVAVFADLPLFVWSDNIGVIVPQDRAGDVERLVEAAFADHGAGPFQMKKMSSRRVSAEFEFLGIWYRKTAVGAEAYVPDAIAQAWEASISGRVITASLKELEEVERSVRDKIARWRYWAGASDLGNYLLSLIASAREALSSAASI